MNFFVFLNVFIFIWTAFCAVPLSAAGSRWTVWSEYAADPIYNPYPTTSLPEDLYPYVVFSLTKFDGNGVSATYKMWHQGNNPAKSIACSTSNDGINWTLLGETNMTPALHPVVLYDQNGFGVGGKPYRMWFSNTFASTTTVGMIQFTQSDDGITWDTPQPIAQNPTQPLLVGISDQTDSNYFYQILGAGFIIYNPNATSTPDQPYTFPFVLFYDIAKHGQSSVFAEGIGLAYSTDGITWSGFYDTGSTFIQDVSHPIFLSSGGSTDWDGTHVFRPSLIQVKGVFHLFYSGSNSLIDHSTSVFYAHGIGHAKSLDGVNWIRDQGNPVFIYTNEVPWRNTRTYTPFVLGNEYCAGQMWFTGGTGLNAGSNQGIGYATIDCN